MQELIKITIGENNQQLVSARELHEFLESKERFSKWFDKMVDYGFEEGVDYTPYQRRYINGGTQLIVDYMVSINMSKSICSLNSKKPKSKEAFKYFCAFQNSEVFVFKQPRKEYLFGELLKGVTKLNWLEQYPINNGKFRLDFYLPNVLIVEYDEKHHKSYVEKDLKRINLIREWLNEYGEFESYDEKWRIPVIRVIEGEELDGLNRIIQHLVGFEEISDRNYNLEPCDIKNF